MEPSAPSRVLVVAHRTAGTPPLLEAVRERAARGSATFTLLVPRSPHARHHVADPEDTVTEEAELVLALALPLLEEAAGSPVEGIIGDSEPLEAIQDAVSVHGFDEIIVSILPARVSRWLRMDLPSKLSGLGHVVTTVTASAGDLGEG